MKARRLGLWLNLVLGGALLHNVLFALVLAAAAGAVPSVLLAVGTGRRVKRLHAQLAIGHCVRIGQAFFIAEFREILLRHWRHFVHG